MQVINAQTILNQVNAAAAIAPEYDAYQLAGNECAIFKPFGFDLPHCEELEINYSTMGNICMHPGHSVVAQHMDIGKIWHSEVYGEYLDSIDAPEFIRFQTGARSFHKIKNIKANLQRFADSVKANAKAFGGGLIKTPKAKPAVTWSSNSTKIVFELLQDRSYEDAMQFAIEKCGALFFDVKNAPFMVWSPMGIEGMPNRVCTVRIQSGKYQAIDTQSGFWLGIRQYHNTRKSAEESALDYLSLHGAGKLADSLEKAPVSDQSAARAEWMWDHQIVSAPVQSETPQDQAPATIQSETPQDQSAAEFIAECVASAAAAAVIESAQNSAAAESLQVVSMAECVAMAGDAGAVNGSGGAMGKSETPQDQGGARAAGFAHDIPARLAHSAFQGTSMSPERRGESTRNEYAQTLESDYEYFKKQAIKGGTLDKLDSEFATYRAGMRRRYTAWLSSESRCISSFITGPSNFPTRRAQKRNDVSHKRLGEYLNFGEMARRAVVRNLRPDLRPIMAGDADAIDRLAAKLAQAEREQERMRKANSAIRKHKKTGELAQIAALVDLGFNEFIAAKMLKPDFCGRIGFADYELTNNNANIRRMRERLEQLETAHAAPVREIESESGIKLEDDAPANRIRLYFPGKPDSTTRDTLKANGFRWSPTIGAWQAYRNYQTVATAQTLAGVKLSDAAPVQTETPQDQAPETIETPSAAPIQSETPQDQAPETIETPSEQQDEHQSVIVGVNNWGAILYTNPQGLPAFDFQGPDSALETFTTATEDARAAKLAEVAQLADNIAAGYDDTEDSDGEDDTPDQNPAGSSGQSETPQDQAPETIAPVVAPVVTKPTTTKTPSAARLALADIRAKIHQGRGQRVAGKGDAWEAWLYSPQTYTGTTYFHVLFFAGRAQKPTHHYRYKSRREALQALTRFAAKADATHAQRAKRTKPEAHDYAAGDVLVSSWGYDQTNIDYYQVTAVIGARMVEVREINQEVLNTGDMDGRCVPLVSQFKGEPMRRMVSSGGYVNVRQAKFGHATRAQFTVIEGMRVYRGERWSAYA